MMDARRQLGIDGERAAEAHLRGRGYTILERNFRCPLGEVDLVALHRRRVVFVEVKTRRSGRATPLDAVGGHKQRQIRRTAEWYLRARGLAERDVRFDVVAVWRDGDQVRCEVLEDAFDGDGGEVW